MIGIVHCGVGNVGSVRNAMLKIGAKSKLIDTPKELYEVKGIILPGVGRFDIGMKKLINSGFRDVLDELVLVKKVPILGICLGMHLLCNRSEEAEDVPGLNWINEPVLRFKPTKSVKVPNMGWKIVSVHSEDKMVSGLGNSPRFYHVHSFYVSSNTSCEVLMKAQHGCEFAAAVKSGNIYGCQFHPEKSHRFGLKILQNFSRISCLSAE